MREMLMRGKVRLAALGCLRWLHVVPLCCYKAFREYVAVASSKLFDADWYLKRYPDVAKTRRDPAWHYVDIGWKEGRQPGPNFDGNAYLAANPDVKKAGKNPLVHYVLYGQKANRPLKPVAKAEVSAVKAVSKKQPVGRNADERRANMCPLQHDLVNGCQVNRPCHSVPVYAKWLQWRVLDHGIKLMILGALRKTGLIGKDKYAELRNYMLLRGTPFLDTEWYGTVCAESTDAGSDTAWHYLHFGWRENLNPSPEFDGGAYLRKYADVKSAGINPLVHFILCGSREGKMPIPVSALCTPARAREVLDRPGDDGYVCADGKNLLKKCDIKDEIRKLEGSALFDAEWYREIVGTAALGGLPPLAHYCLLGWRENRLPSPEFDVKRYVRENPDAQGSNPALHFLEVGQPARHRIHPDKKLCNATRVQHLVVTSSFFDASWYAKQDASLVGQDAERLAAHYIAHGWCLGYEPSSVFSGRKYLEDNSDVRRAKICPLQHYLIHGRYENRPFPSPRDEKQAKANEVARENAIWKRVASPRRIHRRILLITHEFSYTGAPLSLLKAAQCYKAAGMRIVIVSLKEGPLAAEFSKCGKAMVFSNDADMARIACTCDVAIINTLVPFRLYEYLRPILPTIWWVREPVEMLANKQEMKRAFMAAENVYAMSDYSADTFRNLNGDIKVIRHGLDDAYRGVRINPDELVFAVIGTIQPRKGQDLFIEAVKRLSDDLRKKARFVIVGCAVTGKHESELRQAAGGAVEFLGDFDDFQKMIEFYEGITYAVVPSREEPTSRVAIEAMMMGRGVIMSDHVGARYLINSRNGCVFKSGNVEELRDRLAAVICNRSALGEVETAARAAYLKFNAIPIYSQALMRNLAEAKDRYAAGYLTALSAFRKIRTRPAEPSEALPTLSIVIPVYNALEFVENLVETLDAAKFSDRTEVIFVDDCSEPETGRYLKKMARKRGWTLLRNAVNSGFVKTCNRGIKASKGEVVVLLNSDTLVSPLFEQKLRDCFASDVNIACACPVAVHSGWFDFPFDDTETFAAAAQKLSELVTGEYPLFTPEGFCIAFRRSALKKVGLLDEIFGMGYCEEDDLVMRLIRNGYRTVLLHDLLVYHRRHASFSSERRKILFEHNRKIFFHRYGDQQGLLRQLMGCKETVKRITSQLKDALGDAEVRA